MYYLFGSIALLVFFSTALLIRKDLIPQGVISGLVFMIYGPISEIIFFQDYWQPYPVLPTVKIAGYSIMVEDFLFAFSFIGVMSVAYDFFFQQEIIRDSHPRRIALSVVLSILCMVVFILGSKWTSINSIYLSMGISVIFSSIVLMIRKDLLKTSLVSAIICGMGGMFFYFLILIIPGAVDYLMEVWHLSLDKVAVWFLGVPLPLTELLWASVMPLYFSIIYKFASGTGYK